MVPNDEPNPLTNAEITGGARFDPRIIIIAKADGWAACDLRSFFPKYTVLRPWRTLPLADDPPTHLN